MTVVEETLVGRQAELATVEEILARAEARPHGIVLEGEAGIGKTPLWKAGRGCSGHRPPQDDAVVQTLDYPGRPHGIDVARP